MTSKKVTSLSSEIFCIHNTGYLPFSSDFRHVVLLVELFKKAWVILIYTAYILHSFFAKTVPLFHLFPTRFEYPNRVKNTQSI